MKAAIIIVIVLIVAAVFMGIREGKKDQRRRAAEFSRLVSIAGPEDTIYVGKAITMDRPGVVIWGNGCTIEWNPEMAGPTGIRLVRSGVINLEGGAEVVFKDNIFIEPIWDDNVVDYIVVLDWNDPNGITIEDCEFVIDPIY